MNDLSDLLIKWAEVRGRREEVYFKELVQPTYELCREIRDDLQRLYTGHEDVINQSIASVAGHYSPQRITELFGTLMEHIDLARETTRADRDSLRAQSEVQTSEGTLDDFDITVALFVWYSGAHELRHLQSHLRATRDSLIRRHNLLLRRYKGRGTGQLRVEIKDALKRHHVRTQRAKHNVLMNWSAVAERYAELLNDHVKR